MDDVDLAQELEQLRRTEALARQVGASAIAAPGDGTCQDCQDTIPAERLAALPGARFCAFCQGEREGRI
jgi:phage/conjugal plasmid C-4 type zinc finger TraR family protein